jgi:hypothetical protein
MTHWITSEVANVVEEVPEASVINVQPGGCHTTESLHVRVKESGNSLWVRGFRTNPEEIPSDDDIDVEMIEVTTGYSDGDMPNDPVLCVVHTQIKAALMKHGHSVVNSLDPYFLGNMPTIDGPFDAKFHIFQEVNKLLDMFLPKGYQYTVEQADAVHAFAKKLAADMATGKYR